jgi:ubiquinone/menaquinone biosynthesis C-methylase UbiE
VKLHDPEIVREEYASEARLAVRKRANARGDGADARGMVVSAIAEVRPKRVLEVGPGEGELAEEVQSKFACEVVAVDQSPRMVQLTRARNVDARLGDVCDLPFDDETFDCAVAAWMLYHVADIDLALSELARVVRPTGRLVAVTNSRDHWRELKELAGVQGFSTTFDAEEAGMLLARHFGRVDARDASGWLTFANRDEAQTFLAATVIFKDRELPEFEGPLKVRRTPVVFVADKT